MTAALNIAEQGFAVHLLEASDKLGGNVWRVFRTMKKEPVRPYLEELIQKVSSSEDVSVYYNAQVEDVQGFIGNFKTKIRYNGDGEAEIEHGVTVIATGASEWKPDVYGYGTDPRIRTQLEMSAAMEAGDPAVMQAGCTVFIQCVGSRCEERPWCSKVCCNHTVMDAIALKEVNPLHNIYVLYRDMRTFGLNERYYEKARSMGVVFIRYEPDNPPAVEVGGKIAVTVQDLTLGRTMALEADNLVLAAAMVPNENNRELAKLFKVSTHQDGSYLEAHMKLRPVDFATDGIFLAGLAHHPKPLDESIAQAEAAGCHAAEVLARGHIEVPGMISVIDQFLCRGCSRCVDACPFQAPALKEVAVGVFRSEVNPALCKGCGICAVACPTGAAQVHHFKDQQIGVMIEAAMAAEAIGFPVEEEVAVGGEKVEELAPEVPVRVPVAPLIDETTTLDMVEGMLDAALTEEPVRDVMDEPPTYDRAKAMISAALKDSRLRQTLDVALKDERIGYLIDAARRDERLRDMIDEALTEKALREAEHPESASGDMIESERPESKAEKTTDEPPAT
jgi:heterodisulfide reductase subunit A